MLNHGTINGKPYFIELAPGAFSKTFPKGQKGYLHHIGVDYFTNLPGRSSEYEVVSKKAVVPKIIEEIPDVGEAIRGKMWSIHLYNRDSPEYKQVIQRYSDRVKHNKGYEGYLAQKNPALLKDIQTYLAK